MKKSANVDIRNLFQKFGGDAGNYQEIQHEYVSDKAQQNWPIVNAIEKAQVTAPTLKAAATAPPPAFRNNPAPGGSNDSLSAVLARSVQPAARPVSPASPAHSLFGSLTPAAKPEIAEPAVAPARSTFGMFNSLAAAKEPARGLFGGAPAPAEAPQLARGASSGVVNASAQESRLPLRGALQAAVNATAQPARTQTPTRSENDTLNSLFSRLLEPQGAGSAPATDLRSMFGFLNK